MFPGHCTLCIPTQNLPGMQRFHEALGMVALNSHDTGVDPAASEAIARAFI